MYRNAPGAVLNTRPWFRNALLTHSTGPTVPPFTIQYPTRRLLKM